MLSRRRTTAAVLVAFVWCALPGVAAATTPWGIAIVATDPATHQVGAAGAQCAPEDAASMATILPDRGAAVTLPTDPATSERLLTALGKGGAAEALAATRTRTPAPEGRILAVATLGDVGASWVGRRVIGGGEWIGPGAAEATVGVAPRTLAQGASALGGHGSLAERLLGALEATAADHGCHGRPSSAFLIVSDAGAMPVVPARGLSAARTRQRNVLKHVSGQLAADELEDKLLSAGSIPHPRGPHAPAIYLSLLASPEGFGAVTLLQQAYAQISAASPTATASHPPIPTARPTANAAPVPGPSSNGDGRALVLGLLVIAVVAALLGIARRLRRLDEDQKGSPAS